MFVAKRILIITNEIKFALNVKKALERNGEFTVAVFSSGKAGVDHARTHPQDVAVVDFRMKDMPGTDMVDHLRTLNHDIAIIVAPNHPAIQDLKERYNIQRIINLPMSIRKFVASLQSAKQDVIDSQNDDSQPTSIERLSVAPSPQTMEFWLTDNEDGETVLDMSSVEEPDLTPEASATFQRLAAEEPPMPKMSDGSTIRDLRERLTNLDEIKRVLADAAQEETEAEPIEETQDTGTIPAAMILEAAMDQSTPIHTFSVEEFMNRVSDSHVGDISPLPSWQREDQRYITEPDFLPDELPFPEFEEAIEYTGTVTVQTTPELVDQDPSEWVTDPIEPVHRSRPITEDTAPQTTALDADTLDDSEVIEHVADLARSSPPPPPELPDLAVTPMAKEQLPYIDIDDEDSKLAQLATTLTQVALELTADATVLARDGEIVAYAGRIPMTDLEGLLEQLSVEWDKIRGSDKSRIIFAQIPETGAEFMVSTRGTAVGFTLSLIFSGTRPLHDIRRQSKRLVDVLATMPEPEPEIVAEIDIPAQDDVNNSIEDTEEVEVDRVPIAYLWLHRDSKIQLDNTIKSQIKETLNLQLATSGWAIGEIQSSDYVYVYGQMPESLNPRETLDQLMQESAKSLNAPVDQVWDDSYLILQPGREMKTEEIQRFINFARR